MTQPQDPRKHPLQDDEIALARVLRALPAGEPPAHLDDAILKAATDAVAAQSPATPRPRRVVKGVRWLPTWAIGSAAAAVLAVGVGMQLRPPLTPEPSPQASLAEKSSPLPESRERLSVDLVEPAREILPMPAPPPTEASDLRRLRTAPAAPPPPPPPPPAPVEREAAPAAFPASPAPAPAPVASPAPEEAGAFAPPPAPAAAAADMYSEVSVPEANQVDRTGPTRDTAGGVGGSLAADPQPASRARTLEATRRQREEMQQRQARADAAASEREAAARRTAQAAPEPESLRDAAAKARLAALPKVAEDARLAPSAWIERIRERRRLGDNAGARESLRLFIRTHPDAPVPTDLSRLR